MSTQALARKSTNHKKPLTYDPASALVRNEHVPILTTLSLQTIHRLRLAGQFVPAIRLGPNSVAFRRADIERWLCDRQEV